MGGRVFKNNKTVRIKKENIFPTLENLCNFLNYPQFNINYVKKSLLGSTGKKESSGDIDIVMNTHVPKFIGENVIPVFNKHHFYNKCNEKIKNINSTTLKMGVFSITFPITKQKGDIQIDFIFGKHDYIKWSHYSSKNSKFKGVYLTQLFGVMAKHKVEFIYPYDAKVDVKNGIDERIAQINYALNLENGLMRMYRLYNRNRSSFQRVDPDFFETHCPVIPPRLSRFNYIDNPNDIIRILFGNEYTVKDINTLEKALEIIKKRSDYDILKERFITSLKRSAARHDPNFPDLIKEINEY